MKKKITIIASILIILIIGIVLIFVLKNNKKEVELTDAQKFAKEYTQITENNVFVYKDANEIINILKKGTGVVYLGFPECPWCQSYVKYLDELSKEYDLEKIYYFNILEDRKNNTKEYQEIVELLKDNLQYDDEGNPRIYVPNVSFHINGQVIGNDNETSLDTKDLNVPSDYWTEDEVKDLKEKLSKYIIQVNAAINNCTDCNQ